MSQREPHPTWDQRLGRIIRSIFQPFTGRMESVDEWERAKTEAWDREEAEARDVLRDRRARRERER